MKAFGANTPLQAILLNSGIGIKKSYQAPKLHCLLFDYDSLPFYKTDNQEQ